MSKCISNTKLTRQINSLTQYLPDQNELNGKREGSSYYRHVNGKSFIEAYDIVCKRVNGLTQKFNLTTEQEGQVIFMQTDLVRKVKQAFNDHQSPPANFDDFIQRFDKAQVRLGV